MHPEARPGNKGLSDEAKAGMHTQPSRKERTVKIESTPIVPEVEFDMWFYAEISQEQRLDHDLLMKLEPKWNEWIQNLKGYSLKNVEGAGSWLLLFLDGPAEEEIDAIWKESPSDGMHLHSLAITMVMGAARELIPELNEHKCAPLPTPVAPIQDAFEELGLEWVSETTINRKYAVFTHMPYKGGCAICAMEEDCPTKQLADRWKRQ